MIGKLLAAFVVILLGVLLFPMIQEEMNIAQAEGNVTGAADTLLGLTSIFFALVLAIIVLNIVVSAFRNAGMLGTDSDYKEEYKEANKNNPNHKQTYEEYVEERLRIEEKMR